MLKSGIFIGIAFFSLLLPIHRASAQKPGEKENVMLHPDKFYKRFFPRLKIKRNPPDSAYIRSYPYNLAVGIHVLSPAMQVDITPATPNSGDYKSSLKLRSDISDVIGFSGTYRLVSLGFAFLSKSGMDPDYSPSRYRTATIKYNGAADAFQFKYVRIRGFTDINQPDPRDPRKRYTQRPDVSSKEFQFEVIHNFHWKKYSYPAPLTFSQRQIKSHVGFLLKGGVYYNQLSSDSTLVGGQRKQYYQDFSDVRTEKSLALRIAPGLGCTVVFFRRVFFSVSAFTSFDFNFYKYMKNPDEKVYESTAFVFVLDCKVSLGYQSRRFYAGLRFEPERRTGVLHSLKINTTYSYAGLEVGYRFNAPRFVKKFYKKTMPPGM